MKSTEFCFLELFDVFPTSKRDCSFAKVRKLENKRLAPVRFEYYRVLLIEYHAYRDGQDTVLYCSNVLPIYWLLIECGTNILSTPGLVR